MFTKKVFWFLTVVSCSWGAPQPQYAPETIEKSPELADKAAEVQRRLALLKQQAGTRPAVTSAATTRPATRSSAAPPGQVWRWRAKPGAPPEIKEWIDNIDRARGNLLSRLFDRLRRCELSEKSDDAISDEWRRINREIEEFSDSGELPIASPFTGFEFGLVMQVGAVRVRQIIDAKTFLGRRGGGEVRIQGYDTAGLEPGRLETIQRPMRVIGPKREPGKPLIDPVYVLEPFDVAAYAERYLAPAPKTVIRKPRVAQPQPAGSVHALIAAIPTDPSSEIPLSMTELQQKQFPQWAQRNLVGKLLHVPLIGSEFSETGDSVRGFGMAGFGGGAASVFFEVQGKLDANQKPWVPGNTNPNSYRGLKGKIIKVWIEPGAPAIGMKQPIPSRVVFVLTECKLGWD